MPRHGRKQSKPAATSLPNLQLKTSSSSTVSGSTSVNYKAMKRSELQHCCKERGLRATGKNVELVERLQAYNVKSQPKTRSAIQKATQKTEDCNQTAETPLTVSCPSLSQTVKSEPVEEKKEGWCVVHGMTLHRPSSSWAPLLLQRGMVFVQDGENLIPFHLHPLNIPVPDGLPDNYICGNCVIRNRENPKKLRQQTCRSQDFLRSKITLSTSQHSASASCASKDRRRTAQYRKSYQPQEDRAYAQRVDGILFQMAHGELGMDQVLHPLRPLVVHSPAPFSQ